MCDGIEYLLQLEADIKENGGLKEGQSVEDALREAHQRRRAFAEEMREGKTERARMARKAMAAQIYHAIREAETTRRVLAQCAEIAGGAA